MGLEMGLIQGSGQACQTGEIFVHGSDKLVKHGPLCPFQQGYLVGVEHTASRGVKQALPNRGYQRGLSNNGRQTGLSYKGQTRVVKQV
jgi:hypothetical protein